MKRPYAGLQRVEILHTFHHCEGFMYSVPVLVKGDTSEEPLKSKLVFFEDGEPLRRAHERHSTISGTGRGAYSHWERDIYFSTSDNSDPNSNGRTYSYVIDYLGQHGPQDKIESPSDRL